MTASSVAVAVSKIFGSPGNPTGYELRLGDEAVRLESGRSWAQLDHYKWVTRGLIEEPQSFHVGPDGSVDYNGIHVPPQDAQGEARLEAEINKRHPESNPGTTQPPPARKIPGAVAPGRTDRVEFHLKLDHLGHAVIQCLRGTEKTETGLRGLAGLVQSGLMLKPRMLHVDPLQRAIEIDDVRYTCDAEGLRRLEAYLNEHLAPSISTTGEGAIHLRENSASPTGFDIQFMTVRAGARFEVKGHLSQETLDVLQDSAKSGLLARGVLIKLSPPNLLFRRRTPNGGEIRIPELPDLHYLHSNAIEMDAAFNHPVLKNTAPDLSHEEAHTHGMSPGDLVSLRVARHAERRGMLWLEFEAVHGPTEGRALTHHNVADLQHAGFFRAGVEVTLSFDNRMLNVFDDRAGSEAKLGLGFDSTDEHLAKASAMLTAALRPAKPA